MGRRTCASVVVALAVEAFVLACGGQGTDLAQLVDESPESGTSQGGNPAPTQYTDPFAGAPAYGAHAGGGGGGGGDDPRHHAGESCMQQDCHSSSGHSEASPFLIGGTVYQDYAGTTPAVGVEVRVVDSAGNAASTYSDSVGNFFIHASNTSVTLPANVGARDATTTRPMITQLTGAMGSCNQSSCHVRGGRDAGAYYPIHVP